MGSHLEEFRKEEVKVGVAGSTYYSSLMELLVEIYIGKRARAKQKAGRFLSP